MQNLERALKFTLSWEGGWSNDPDDRGGATMYGIIQTEYDRYRKQNGCAVQSVRFISQVEVQEIYLKYWNGSHAGAFEFPLAVVMFDVAVNNGIGRSIKFYQELRGLTVDGAFGPKTKADMHKVGDMPPQEQKDLAIKLVDRRERFYRSIATGTQKKFLKGWLNRNNALRKLVNES